MTIAANQSQPSRILVVDDEDLNRKLLEATLLPEGYAVVQAETGEDALRLLGEADIDLVLLDLLMPGMSGIEVCRRIRADARHPFLPVVLTTALHDRESRILGKAAGADDFLSKPIDISELLARVENLLLVHRYHKLERQSRENLEAELDSTRRELLRIERLATLGTLAAGIGHELANVAMIVKAVHGMLRDSAEKGAPPEEEDLRELERAGDHLAVHSRHLLAQGRPGTDRPEVLDLNQVVTGTLAMLRTAGRTKYVEVQTQFPEGAVAVTMNRTRLEQLLVNLVNNAVDALETVQGRPKRVSVTVDRTSKGRVVCTIADTGIGIPADKLEAIFTPYYTTKPPGRGTGLGLPVVKQIVEGLGGHLSVQSRFGEGASFTVELPTKRS